MAGPICPDAGNVLLPQLDGGGGVLSQASTAAADSPSPTSNARLKMLFMVLTPLCSGRFAVWIAWPYCNKTTCNEIVLAG